VAALEVSRLSLDELVYDWNTIDPELRFPDRHIGFDDETLRDGLQSPSVSEPPVEMSTPSLKCQSANWTACARSATLPAWS